MQRKLLLKIELSTLINRGCADIRIDDLPRSEYAIRIKKLQKKLEENNLDAIICYSSECESGVVRYFTGFWPFFDFASLVIPREGDTVLVTGGPESLDFAREFSKISDIKVNPLLVETSAPEWVREVIGFMVWMNMLKWRVFLT